MRGFGPARRGPFVSAKGPKTRGARAWPFGGLCPGPDGEGCGTRCAQTVLAPISNSGPGRSHARRCFHLTPALSRLGRGKNSGMRGGGLTGERSFTYDPLAMPSLAFSFEQIVAFHRRYRRMPSYQEIARLVRFRSKNAVWKLVQQLIAQGRLAQDAKGRLLPTKYFHEIPWLGTVVAGFPSPADEELLDVMSLEEYLGYHQDATYLLRVSGDSMIDAGILPGDLVLVERRESARSGEIVVAEVDGEWTMKTYRKRGRRVILEPANAAYPPIVPKDVIRIVAVVKAVIRKY